MRNYCISISGLPGAGSTTSARLLSEKLSLGFFSSGRLFKDLARGTLSEQLYYPLFKQICDARGLLLPVINQGLKTESHAAQYLWSTDFGRNPELHEAIDELQTELAKRGNIVIDGKLSLFMLKDISFKIWLKASLEERIIRTAKRDNLHIEEVEKTLPSREETQHREWQEIYGLDYLKQESEADLVIDTTNLNPEQAIELILNTLKQS